jgi:Flp pilus assembly protein TadD
LFRLNFTPLFLNLRAVFFLISGAAMILPFFASAQEAPPLLPQPNEEIPVDDLLKKIQSEPATAGSAAPMPEVNATPPGEARLSPASSDLTGQSDPGAIDIPSLPQVGTPAEDNLFFDSEVPVPRSQMKSMTPRKVDPVTQPASKLVVVQKDHEPGSMQAQLISAQRAIALGRYDSALRLYDALYIKNNRDPNILFGRATALQKLNRRDEAIVAYEKLLEISPKNYSAKINMLGLLGERYPAVALQRLKAIADERPSDPALLAQIGIMEANLSDYAAALESLGVAAGLEPNNPLHIYNMAIIADRSGNKAQALKYYERALEIDTIYGNGRGIPREDAMARMAQIR